MNKDITLDNLKELVERYAFVDDISVASRKGELPEYRFVFFALCRFFKKQLKKPTYEQIGNIVNRDHASVTHGLKQFDKGKLYMRNNPLEVYNLLINKLKEQDASEMLDKWYLVGITEE